MTPYRELAARPFARRPRRQHVDRLATHLRAITFGTLAIVVALAYVLDFIGRHT